jgi:hypothetical protein
MQSKKSHTILSIVLFLLQGAIVYLLYKMFTNLENAPQVSKTDIFQYNLFLIALTLLAIGFCTWCLFLRAHSFIKAICLSLVIGQILLAFNLHYKSMGWPYNFRLTLVNKTNHPLDKLRLTGCQDIEVDTIKINTSREFLIPITEGCSVYLVNRNDSVAIASASAVNTGYKKEYIIQ